MGNPRRSQSIRLTSPFIKTHRREFDTVTMCRFLGGSHSGFYQWLPNPLYITVTGARPIWLMALLFLASLVEQPPVDQWKRLSNT
jgi:hypothetical protein